MPRRNETHRLKAILQCLKDAGVRSGRVALPDGTTVEVAFSVPVEIRPFAGGLPSTPVGTSTEPTQKELQDAYEAVLFAQAG